MMQFHATDVLEISRQQIYGNQPYLNLLDCIVGLFWGG